LKEIMKLTLEVDDQANKADIRLEKDGGLYRIWHVDGFHGSIDRNDEVVAYDTVKSVFEEALQAIKNDITEFNSVLMKEVRGRFIEQEAEEE